MAWTYIRGATRAVYVLAMCFFQSPWQAAGYGLTCCCSIFCVACSGAVRFTWRQHGSDGGQSSSSLCSVLLYRMAGNYHFLWSHNFTFIGVLNALLWVRRISAAARTHLNSIISRRKNCSVNNLKLCLNAETDWRRDEWNIMEMLNCLCCDGNESRTPSSV